MKFRVIIWLLLAFLMVGSTALSQDIPVKNFDYHVGRVNSLAISPDGQYLASGSDDKTVNVIEISSGNIISKTKFPSRVQAVDFSFNGEFVAGASAELIIITNLSTKESKQIDTFSGIEEFRFSTISSNEIFVVADVENQTGTFIEGLFKLDIEQQQQKKFCSGTNIRSISIDNNGSSIFVAVSNKLKQFDLNKDTLIREFTAPSPIFSVDLYPDYKGIASCAQGGVIYWIIETGKSVPYHSTVTEPYLVKAGLNNNYFVIADKNSLRLRKHFVTSTDLIVTGVSAINDFKISPDSRFLITADESSIIKIWDNPYYDASESTYQNRTAAQDKTSEEAPAILSKDEITDELLVEQYKNEIESELNLRPELFAPRDEFEKTADYEARVEEASNYQASIIEFYRDKHWEQIRFQLKQDSVDKARRTVLLEDKIRDSYREVNFLIDSLGRYNADAETFPAFVRGDLSILKMPVDEARTFKLNFQKAIVYGTEQLEEDGITLDTFNMQVVHPITGNPYPMGVQDETYANQLAYSNSKPDVFIDTLEIQTMIVENRRGKQLEHNVYEEEFLNALNERKYYGLFIGIDDYLDDQINDLEYPIKDARNMYDILNKKYGFDSENSTILENPTRTEIINTFDDLAINVSSTDQLLIFYAGHGKWDDKLEQGYWLPRDARKDSKAQWLSNGTIRDYIRGINSKHTLLVADACFSGGIFKTRDLFNTSSKAALELYKLPSRKAITSGTMNTVPDKSVFMKYLLKRLENNKSQILTSSTLFGAFREAVINNSAVSQVPQYGEIRESGDEGGDFVFMKK
ncbi:caspase family protein [Bacteroidota bacterium]